MDEDSFGTSTNLVQAFPTISTSPELKSPSFRPECATPNHADHPEVFKSEGSEAAYKIVEVAMRKSIYQQSCRGGPRSARTDSSVDRVHGASWESEARKDVLEKMYAM